MVSQDEGTWKLALNQIISTALVSQATQNEWSQVPVCTYRQDEESMPTSLLRHLDVILLWGNTECWQLLLLRWRNYIAFPTHTICEGMKCCGHISVVPNSPTKAIPPRFHKHTELKLIVFIAFCSTNTHSDQQWWQKEPQTYKIYKLLIPKPVFSCNHTSSKVSYRENWTEKRACQPTAVQDGVNNKQSRAYDGCGVVFA